MSITVIGLDTAKSVFQVHAMNSAGLGPDVKLVAPEAVRPFVKKGKKNDAADAAGICEAASRPGVRFVPTKSLEQQGVPAELVWAASAMGRISYL